MSLDENLPCVFSRPRRRFHHRVMKRVALRCERESSSNGDDGGSKSPIIIVVSVRSHARPRLFGVPFGPSSKQLTLRLSLSLSLANNARANAVAEIKVVSRKF